MQEKRTEENEHWKRADGLKVKQEKLQKGM